MSDVTISQGEYNDLQKSKANSERYEADIAKLEDTNKNKAIALNEEREKRKTAETSITDIQWEMETLKTNHSSELEKFTDFDSLKEWSDNWTKHQEAVISKRVDSIKSYKDTLWEEFMTSKESFLNGLPDDKIETFLKDNVDAMESNKGDWNFQAPWSWDQWDKKGWTSAYETAKANKDVAWMIAAQAG